MVFQLRLHSGLDNSTGISNFERTDQPGKKIANSFILQQISLNKYDTLPEEKEDNLDSTDDGKPSEETHGASNKTQLGLRLDLLVSLDVVKGGRVKVDLHQLES